MSKITIKDLGFENQSKTIKKFAKKLDELSQIEKELNQEGFEIIIQPISKKGQINISENP